MAEPTDPVLCAFGPLLAADPMVTGAVELVVEAPEGEYDDFLGEDVVVVTAAEHQRLRAIEDAAREENEAAAGLLPMLDREVPHGLHAGEFVRRTALRDAAVILRTRLAGVPTEASDG